jgi:hypothetical protein
MVLDPREKHDFARLATSQTRCGSSAAARSCTSSRMRSTARPCAPAALIYSRSGEDAQDNDLIMIRDGGGSADAFEAHFERMWEAAAPMIEFGPAIDALEVR